MIAKMRTRLETAERRAGTKPAPRRRRPKPTTAETRQELDRILAHIESLPPGAPANTEPGHPTVEEARRELDRVLASMSKRDAEP
jgi:hypothetical protein